ncbi:MAG: hypothetical protein ABUL64_02805 [Singulisphaera sp.]
MFVFGSSRFEDDAHDIDILVVYDNEKIPAAEAFDRFRPIFDTVMKSTGLSVHPVVISTDEEREQHFIASVRPIVVSAET